MCHHQTIKVFFLRFFFPPFLHTWLLLLLGVYIYMQHAGRVCLSISSVYSAQCLTAYSFTLCTEQNDWGITMHKKWANLWAANNPCACSADQKHTCSNTSQLWESTVFQVGSHAWHFRTLTTPSRTDVPGNCFYFPSHFRWAFVLRGHKSNFARKSAQLHVE